VDRHRFNSGDSACADHSDGPGIPRYDEGVDLNTLLRARRHQLAAVGAILAIGAPSGLLLLRWVVIRGESPMQDLKAQPITYAYLWLSTTVVFSIWGYWVGRKTDELVSASFSDPLTGLWNRRYLHQRTVEETRRSLRHDTCLSFLLVDVDRLKRINDQGGHEQGDEALRTVAGAISRVARATDVVARWGGDEFAILSPHTRAQQACALAKRIHETLEELAGDAGPITVSIGISDTNKSAAADERALLLAADAALYEAKRLGRNRTELAPPSLLPQAPSTSVAPEG
jgi:diguanylate cyclase (GGDEF)-like protein